jgi:hypothetical protein
VRSSVSAHMARRQGLTIVHFTAQREHFLSHVLGCLAGFSAKTAEVEQRGGRVQAPARRPPSAVETRRAASSRLPTARGLHSSTFRLDESTFCVIFCFCGRGQ